MVREDTAAVLGIHRGAYKLVTNREVFEPFDEAITGSGIALEGITVEEGIAYEGRTVVREYTFPGVHTRTADRRCRGVQTKGA